MTLTNLELETVVCGERSTVEKLLTDVGVVTYSEGCLLALSTATGKLVPYVKGGSTAGNGVASHVLLGGVDSISGDVGVTAIKGGDVRLSHLSIIADGDNSAIDANVILELRSFGINVHADREVSELDNQ